MYENETFNEIYFLTYDFTAQNFTILSFLQMRPYVNLLINRIWGSQVGKQIGRWMDLFSKLKLNINPDLYFPGDVVSVFISNY